jgi:hypothetical protein
MYGRNTSPVIAKEPKRLWQSLPFGMRAGVCHFQIPSLAADFVQIARFFGPRINVFLRRRNDAAIFNSLIVINWLHLTEKGGTPRTALFDRPLETLVTLLCPKPISACRVEHCRLDD